MAINIDDLAHEYETKATIFNAVSDLGNEEASRILRECYCAVAGGEVKFQPHPDDLEEVKAAIAEVERGEDKAFSPEQLDELFEPEKSSCCSAGGDCASPFTPKGQKPIADRLPIPSIQDGQSGHIIRLGIGDLSEPRQESTQQRSIDGDHSPSRKPDREDEPLQTIQVGNYRARQEVPRGNVWQVEKIDDPTIRWKQFGDAIKMKWILQRHDSPPLAKGWRAQQARGLLASKYVGDKP